MKVKFLNALISIVSILLMFTVLELATRIYKGEYSFKNYLEEKSMFFRSAYPAQYDPDLLGWFPKIGTSGKENVWGTTVTILEHGIRSNGENKNLNKLSDSAPILVVGGSFTFGDQVSNHETWPAILERLVKKKVINAAVFGYGTDQAFLRAEKLMEIYKPDTLIFSVVSDHILRCELSERNGVSKPYFEVSDNTLILRNIPVPPPSQEQAIIGKFRKILGYSFFMHNMMMRLIPEYWLQGRWHNTKVHSEGEKVACLLFQKLEDIAKAENIKVYILLQYHDMTSKYHGVPIAERLAIMDHIISCLNRTSLKVVDLKQALIDMRKHDENEYKNMYKGHMTYKGNYFVASKIQEAMKLK